MTLLVFSILFATFFYANLMENFYREQERKTFRTKSDKKSDSLKWHRFQHLGWITFYLLGGTLIFSSLGISPLDYAKIGFLYSALWWVMYDGLLNILRDYDFWFNSGTSNNDFVQFNHKKTKLIVLTISILVLLFV